MAMGAGVARSCGIGRASAGQGGVVDLCEVPWAWRLAVPAGLPAGLSVGHPVGIEMRIRSAFGAPSIPERTGSAIPTEVGSPCAY